MRETFFSLGLNIFWVFIFLQLAWHYYVIEVKRKEPNHLLHFWIRFIVAFVIAAMWHELTIINLATYGITFWFGFDTLLNILRRKSIIHLGNSTIDTFQKTHPDGGEFMWFCLKAITFLGLVGAYYFN
jgi:hypothetical protein